MGSSSQQLYSLSWGEYGSSLTSAVQLLRGQGDLVDVTLAAGGRTFAAHKIVLGAASPFLLDLLKDTPCQHPVVMLAGVDAEDLECLLEFVYRGEVSVEPSQLPSLLQAAHCLSIHGLTPPTIFTQNGETIPPTVLPQNISPVTQEPIKPRETRRRSKKRRKSTSSSSVSKWSRTDHGEIDNKGHDDGIVDYDRTKDAEGVSHDDMGDDSRSRSTSEQPTICPLCGAILRQSRNLRRHLELLHFGLGNSAKSPGVRIRRTRTENPTELHRSSYGLGPVARATVIDNSHQLRTTENSNFSKSTSLSLASTVSSGASNISYPGNPTGLLSIPVIPEPSSRTISSGTPSSSSCGLTLPGTLSGGIYSSDSGATLLSRLLPNLHSLSSFRSPEDVLRHGEIIRASMAYHDASLQFNGRTRHPADVT